MPQNDNRFEKKDLKSMRDVVAEITDQEPIEATDLEDFEEKGAIEKPQKKRKKKRKSIIDVILFSRVSRGIVKSFRWLIRQVTFVRFMLFAIVFVTFLVIIFTWKTISVNEQTITVIGADSRIEDCRIVVLSDLNGIRIGDEQLKILDKLEDIKYDIVICLGDMVGEDGDPEPFYELLEGIPSNKQVYFIAGDSDPDIYVSKLRNEEAPLRQLVLSDWILGAEERGAIFVDAPMKIQIDDAEVWLVPASMLNVEASSNLSMWKEQVSQEESGYLEGIKADMNTLPFSSYRLWQAQTLNDAITVMDDNSLVIALTHVPCSDSYLLATSYVHDEGKYIGVPDMMLGGHYCGGVWNLPGEKAFYVPDSTLENYGWFPDQKLVKGLREVGNTEVFITKGLSTCGDVPLMPFRLFNNPEICVLTLSAVAPQNLSGN